MSKEYDLLNCVMNNYHRCSRMLEKLDIEKERAIYMIWFEQMNYWFQKSQAILENGDTKYVHPLQ